MAPSWDFAAGFRHHDPALIIVSLALIA